MRSNCLLLLVIFLYTHAIFWAYKCCWNSYYFDTGIRMVFWWGWLLFDGMHSQAGLGNEIPLILGVIRSITITICIPKQDLGTRQLLALVCRRCYFIVWCTIYFKFKWLVRFISMIVQWLTGVEIAKIGRSFQLSAFVSHFFIHIWWYAFPSRTWERDTVDSRCYTLKYTSMAYD
jgi:hypothetical protein